MQYIPSIVLFKAQFKKYEEEIRTLGEVHISMHSLDCIRKDCNSLMLIKMFPFYFRQMTHFQKKKDLVSKDSCVHTFLNDTLHFMYIRNECTLKKYSSHKNIKFLVWAVPLQSNDIWWLIFDIESYRLVMVTWERKWRLISNTDKRPESLDKIAIQSWYKQESDRS